MHHVAISHSDVETEVPVEWFRVPAANVVERQQSEVLDPAAGMRVSARLERFLNLLPPIVRHASAFG